MQFGNEFRKLFDRWHGGVDVLQFVVVGGFAGKELFGASGLYFGFYAVLGDVDGQRFDTPVAQSGFQFGVGNFFGRRVAVVEYRHEEEYADGQIDPIEVESWFERFRLVGLRCRLWFVLLVVHSVVVSVVVLFYVGVFGDDGIGPKVFDVVEGACFAAEYVYDDCAVVERNPFAVFETVGGKWFFAGVFAHIVFHLVGDGGNVYVGVAFAYHKVLTRRVQFGHIHGYNAFGFLLLHAGNDGINQFFFVFLHTLKN